MADVLSHSNKLASISLRTLFNTIPDLIFYKDMEGVYLACNQAFCELPGKARESEIIGSTDYDLFDSELADFFREKDLATLSSNALRQNDERVIYPDGREVLLNTLRVPFTDSEGDVIGVIGISRDISRGYQAPCFLQENEDKYSHLFEATEDFMGLIVDKKFVVINHASAKLLGYDSAKILTGIGPPELSPEFQDDGIASCKKSEAMMAIAFEKGFHRFEWTHKKNNGDTFPVEVSLTRVPYQARQALLCIWRDISERKQLEFLEKCRGDILEVIATRDVLTDVLKTICLSVEQYKPDILCSILLLDDEGKHLLGGAAPNLPDFYIKAVHGMEIGREAGSCGTAAFTGKRVIANIAQEHHYWPLDKELAIKAGLLSCWSEPIRSSQGKILGSFAIYHRYQHRPTKADIQLIEQSAHLTSIAVEKHQTRLALISSEERWVFAIEGSGDGVWDWDIQTDKTICSNRWKEMLGYDKDEITPTRQQWLDRIHPEDRGRVTGALQDYLEGKQPNYVLTYRLCCKDGSYKWILGRGMIVRHDENNKPLRMVGTHTDITELKQAEEKLKLATSIFSHAREGITITDAEGCILDVNATFTKITGYSREEILGKNPRILKSGRQSPDFYARMWATLLRDGSWTGEIWNRRKNGEVYAEQLTISTVHNSSTGEINYVGLFTDITQQKTHRKQLQRMAHYDGLTNLPNRELITSRLTQAMNHTELDSQSIAVLYIDLDGFKAINDQYGRNIGDKLLIAVSHKLKEVLRGGDILARVGGDEFVVVLGGISKTQDYVPILERLLTAASSPFDINNKTLQVSASIGVTIYPQDDVGAGVLIRHADQAMYTAKQEGKNRYHLFDTALDVAVKVHCESLNDIRQALNQHEFILYYQPKVNMRTGAIVGAEALIRWQHPDRGLVPPNDFLPVIENTQLSIAVGEWVIDSALGQMAAWNALGLDIPVSVNIGAFQLQSDGFAERLAAQLAEHPEVAPQSLELEVLETSELGDMAQVTDIMNACIALGVSFALDDFGTGYASLSYIRRLPAQMIKIDQTFIRDMLDDVNDLAIVESVIALAKSFKRDVIAEGVETIEHGSKLLKLGCELAQGYGIARPMPAKEFPAWTETWHPDKDWS